MTNEDTNLLTDIDREIRRLQGQASQIRANETNSFVAYLKSLVWVKDYTFRFEESLYNPQYKLLFNFPENLATHSFYSCVIFGDEKYFDQQVRFKFEPYGTAVLECRSADVLTEFIAKYNLKINNAEEIRLKGKLYTELSK